MKAITFDNLMKKYIEKADYHGYLSIKGDNKFKKFHSMQEKMYDNLIIKIGEKYLREIV